MRRVSDLEVQDQVCRSIVTHIGQQSSFRYILTSDQVQVGCRSSYPIINEFAMRKLRLVHPYEEPMLEALSSALIELQWSDHSMNEDKQEESRILTLRKTS
jgi:hypothetical protein